MRREREREREREGITRGRGGGPGIIYSPILAHFQKIPSTLGRNKFGVIQTVIRT